MKKGQPSNREGLATHQQVCKPSYVDVSAETFAITPSLSHKDVENVFFSDESTAPRIGADWEITFFQSRMKTPVWAQVKGCLSSIWALSCCNLSTQSVRRDYYGEAMWLEGKC